jgi:hypothetical protein
VFWAKAVLAPRANKEAASRIFFIKAFYRSTTEDSVVAIRPRLDGVFLAPKQRPTNPVKTHRFCCFTSRVFTYKGKQAKKNRPRAVDP